MQLFQDRSGSTLNTISIIIIKLAPSSYLSQKTVMLQYAPHNHSAHFIDMFFKFKIDYSLSKTAEWIMNWV